MLFKLTICDQAKEESGDRAELETKVALVDTMVDSFIKVEFKKYLFLGRHREKRRRQKKKVHKGQLSVASI